MSEKKYIGIDIGGTSAKIGLVTEKGEVIEKEKASTLKNEKWQVIIDEFLKPVHQWIKNGYVISGVGIGVPGFYNVRTGRVNNCCNIPGLINAPITDYIKEKLDLSASVDNDATAAALGEKIFGLGKNYSDYLLITLGTGIGGGLVLNDKIYRGNNGFAGEFGHINVVPDGRACTCGKKGCIEAYSSVTALVNKIKEGIEKGLTDKYSKNEKINGRLIFEKAYSGCEYSNKVIDEAVNYLGIALGSVVNLLNLKAIIIGGGMAKQGDFLIDKIRTSTFNNSWKLFTADLEVVQSALLDNAGILGAVCLVI